MLKCILGEYGPSATLNGSSLVLSLPDANRPVVWTLDLHKDGHGALTLDQDSETGEYILVFQGTKKGADVLEIARYSAKGKAVKAMVAASTSMKSAISDTNASTNVKTSNMNLFTQWFVTIIGIIVLVALYFIVTGGPQGFNRTPIGQALNSRLSPAPQYMPPQQAQETNQRANPPADAVGVPMDADNFFEELMNK
jgi:hypothetical protein